MREGWEIREEFTDATLKEMVASGYVVSSEIHSAFKEWVEDENLASSDTMFLELQKFCKFRAKSLSEKTGVFSDRTDDEIATTLALWCAGVLRRNDVLTLLGLRVPDGLEALLKWMPHAYSFDLAIPSRHPTERKVDRILGLFDDDTDGRTEAVDP